MTNNQINETARTLGIKPCRAPVGSQVWECWAGRVQQAEMDNSTFRRSNDKKFSLRRDVMVIEANCYA